MLPHLLQKRQIYLVENLASWFEAQAYKYSKEEKLCVVTTLNDTFSVQKHEGQLKINPYYIHSSTMSKEILRESRVEVSVFKVHFTCSEVFPWLSSISENYILNRLMKNVLHRMETSQLICIATDWLLYDGEHWSLMG